MYRIVFVMLIVAGMGFLSSCHNDSALEGQTGESSANRILQQKDGTIALKLDKAACYSDKQNPSSNTAEWNVVVSKSGRFDVWLTSATKDTTNLNYQNSVKVNFQDNSIEARPACDKIIHNASDVSLPYYKADSFLGSLYIRDTGMYSVQVISDKILPQDNQGMPSSSTATKLLSVVLTPIKY